MLQLIVYGLISGSILALGAIGLTLIYGILNIGTFSDDQAEVLRQMGMSEQVQSLTSHTQSYVLKRLMEVLKIE